MSAYSSIPVNPFDDNAVKTPRDVSFSVPGLNDDTLKTLVERFGRLDSQRAPRKPVGALTAQLVTSPDAGYGKSHLLGRLFSTLGKRATKVFLRPFEDPYKAWHSILLLTISELERPEGPVPLYTPTTQLQAMAVAVLARLAADVITADGIPGRAESCDAIVLLLRKAAADPQPPNAQIHHWIDCLAKGASETYRGAQIVQQLRARGLDLGGREKAWVKVLAAHALNEPQHPRALAATKWLRAEPLELDDIALLDLEAADSDVKADCPAQEVNALSLERLLGLCLLASYYRPFLFCFDQTELYARDPALVIALGNCIERLYADIPNQLTIITANSVNWQDRILPRMDQPQIDRISAEIPLMGVQKDSARELITGRLKACALAPADVERFFADGWLDTFYNIQREHGARAVLKRAATRFQELAKKPIVPRPTLEELFQREVKLVHSPEERQSYNQDALMWFVREIGSGLAGASIERTQARYFSLQWSWPERLVSFAFEGGAHWNRWRAIARESLDISHQNAGRACLAYVFRTPDLEVVPRKSWKEAKPDLDAAAAHGLQIVELTLEQVCDIHAARQLHSDALERNIDYPADQTLAWLQAHFLPFLKELAERQLPAERRAGSEDHPPLIVGNRQRRQLPLPIGLDAKSL